MCSRVFVGRLDLDVYEEDLEKFFEGFGRINDIMIKRGFAFVEFSDPLDADDAVFCLKGKTLNGKRINLELARGMPRSGGSGPRYGGSRRQGNWIDKYGPICRTEHQLIVENLSSRVSWQDLKDSMRKTGAEVTYANAHTDRRNEGIVEFATHSDMMKAYDKLDGYEMQGRRIKLIINKPRHKSRRSRSRSSSRSGSYHRYRGRRGSRSRSASRSPAGRSKSRSQERRSLSKSREMNKERGSRSRSTSNGKKGASRSRSPSRDNNSRSRSRSIDHYVSRSQSPEGRD